MSFWEKATGVATPAPAPAAPQGYQQPGYVQQGYVQPGYTQPGVYPQAGPSQEDLAVAAAKAKAPSSRSTLMCPNCGSDHIVKPSANIMETCYTCGWNPRFEQSTAGAIPSSDAGPAKPSRQVSTANNFQPQTIIGKV